MKDLSITARMLVVALAPAVLVAVLLGAWFMLDRLREVERAELARAHTLAEGLALAGEFGVATGNAELLEGIAEPMLRIPSIVAIGFDDDLGRTLHESVDRVSPEDRHHADGIAGHWWTWLVGSADPVRIEQPVFRTDLSVFDEPLFDAPRGAGDGDAAAAARRIGTLDLVLDLSPAYHRQFATTSRALAVTALVLLLATPAAVWLARGVSRPVREVTHAMERLARHEYVDVEPLRADGGGELGELARGVRQLSMELDAFRVRVRESARITTDDLHVALDALERRNRELDDARAAAERASAFKSDFLANMSHEIRTPMNTVIGTLSTLTRSALNADQREQVRLIERASGSLLALIDDLLDISRIETGNLRVEHVPCELVEVLEEVALGVADFAVERGIELFVAPPSADVPPFIASDPLRLRQILINLLTNAIKFTREGHVALEVASTFDRAGACTLRLSVTDTGIGIPRQLQDGLFAAFAQADMSTTRSHGGAGLGLHICKGIVTVMGGRIALASAPGRGSRFTVTIPVRALERPSGHARAVDDRAPPLAMRYEDGYTPLAGANRRALELAGVRVVEGPDGAPRPSLIAVPSRVLRAIGTRGTAAYVPPAADGRRVALVTRTTPDIRRWLAEAGFDACVRRTPRTAALRRSLEGALGGESATDELARHDDTVPGGAPHSRARARSTDAGERLRILAIDDQRINLDVLARFFAHLDVEGSFARTDEEVVRELAGRRFDMILLDLHMPVRDGFEIARELRESDSPNRRTPLLALTADAYADSRARALAGGFDAVLTKPMTVDRLDEEIGRRLVARGAGTVDGSGFPESGDGPIVSIAACAANMLGDVDWATRAIATYAEELPQHVETLVDAAARRDRGALLHCAHTLKGVSGVCRVTRVVDAARALERALDAGDWERVTAPHRALVELLGRAGVDCERALAAVPAPRPPPAAAARPVVERPPPRD